MPVMKCQLTVRSPSTSGITLLYSDRHFDSFVEHLGLRSAMN